MSRESDPHPVGLTRLAVSAPRAGRFEYNVEAGVTAAALPGRAGSGRVAYVAAEGRPQRGHPEQL
jgi:hypothetical protein